MCNIRGCNSYLYYRRGKMEDISKVGMDETSVFLTGRELTLIKWSLESMAKNALKGGNIRSEIANLRSKLATNSIPFTTEMNSGEA
jgi:hypothetical protein